MENMQTTVKKMEERLKLWDAKLDALTAKAEVAGVQSKIDLRQRVEEIKAKRAVARAKFDEFKTSQDGKWDHVKDHVDSFSNDLEAVFKEFIRE